MTPATEKAAPIPALLPCPFCGGAASVRPDEVGSGGQHVGPYWAGCPMPWGCGVVFQGDDPEEAAEAWNRRADRASQEERIREDEPLPERLRKSYEKGAQDERDRLYEAGLKWPRDVCDFLEIEGAKVRARPRGDAS